MLRDHLRIFFKQFLSLLNFILYILFIYFWLCWIFVAAQGLSLVAASGGYSPVSVHGLLIEVASLLQGTGSRHTGSVVVAHWLSCPAAYGIFPDQGSNWCSLHRQAGSQALDH